MKGTAALILWSMGMMWVKDGLGRAWGPGVV